VLAKSSSHLHAKHAHVADSRWFKLFAFDDDIAEDDMEHDRTDLDPDALRRMRLAQQRGSENAALESAKRKQCERNGTHWSWIDHKDRDPAQHPTDTVEPSYVVPGQLGYDTPLDRSLVLKNSGFLTGA